MRNELVENVGKLKTQIKCGGKNMKAVVCNEYGSSDVLSLTELEKPIPSDNEVLIKVYATTVTPADSLMRRGDSLIGRIILGLRRPRKKYKIPGLELAGEIEDVGKRVKLFKRGDQVYGFTGFEPGAYAEYKCMSENASLTLKPSNMDYGGSAAVVDGASTAMFFLKEKANIQKGEKVIINGASGSIGTFAVQIAKYFGAHVTGVCSTGNLELVKSLGADKVIDYTKEDFTRSNEKYDIIFDTVGKSSFSQCKGVLNKKGRYLVTIMGIKPIVLTILTRFTGGKRVIFGMSVEKTKSLIFIRKLIEAGKLKPVMDRCYPLEKISEAHDYVENGHKRGNVIITV